MFERYTEKARRVIFQARAEASAFGSPYIEAEFLLLGILRIDPYVVTRWLDPAKNWQEVFQKEVEKRVGRRPSTPTSVDLPLSNESKQVLTYAAEEVERLQHQWLGPEHLFLGLLREKKAHASKLLHDFGIHENQVREALRQKSEAYVPAAEPEKKSLTVRHFQTSIIIEDEGSQRQVFWPNNRIPVAGEFLTLEEADGQQAFYQVARVEWVGVSNGAESYSLSKVNIHVQKLP
jgi:ATP-dependent Clp protease ATP-binding subunit ClpC